MPGPGWAKLARAARNPDHRDRAARASASLALPMLVGVLAGDPRAGMVAATGGFAGLLAGVVPFQRRARVLASLTIVFPLAIVVGTLAAPSAVAASVAPGVLAAVAAFMFRAFAVPAPREYPLVLACLMATGLPADPSAAPARALEAFGGAAAAFAIGMVGYRRPATASGVQPEAGGAGIRARLSAAMDRDTLVIPTAARMGIAVAAGAGLGHAIGLSRPYWAGLTVAAVLQGATGPLQRRRAVDRAVGTVIGVVLAQPLVELHPPLGLDVAAVALCMFVAQIVIRASYAVAVVFMTQLPIFMMDLAGADPGPAITSARLIDTLIGCALGAAITQVPFAAQRAHARTQRAP
jgi:hypothetical protein